MRSQNNLSNANSSFELLQFIFWWELSENQEESIQGGATNISLQGEADAASGQATGKRKHLPIHSIQSIHALLGGGDVNEIRWDDKGNTA